MLSGYWQLVCVVWVLAAGVCCLDAGSWCFLSGYWQLVCIVWVLAAGVFHLGAGTAKGMSCNADKRQV